MIEFFDDSGVVGTVSLDGDQLRADDAVRSYADRWLLDRSAVEFETFYDGWSNGYVSARRVDDAVTAAAEPHTGAMVALVPSDADAARLAVEGGEPADQLHVTLTYLGEAALVPVEVRRLLVDTVVNVVAGWPTVVGDAFSVNLFNPEDLTAGGGEPCVVLGLGGSLLEKVHNEICSAVHAALRVVGVDIPQQHSPWVPHITLRYAGDADLTAYTGRTGPVTFDAVRLAFGDEVYDVPLGDGGQDDDDETEEADEVDNAYEVDAVVADSFDKERDVNAPGGGHNLRNYWVRGEGAAKIGWGTDGSFKRCVGFLSEHVRNPQGLCAEYHKAATGEWPAEKGVESVSETDTFDVASSFVLMAGFDDTTVVAESGDECPEGHHRMPNGRCMSDEVMSDYDLAAAHYFAANSGNDVKKPYGDVRYADPGYQADGRSRYPLDTEDHIRAAWSYINMPKNASKYSTDDLRKVRAKIRAAMKRIGAEVVEDTAAATNGAAFHGTHNQEDHGNWADGPGNVVDAVYSQVERMLSSGGGYSDVKIGDQTLGVSVDTGGDRVSDDDADAVLRQVSDAMEEWDEGGGAHVELDLDSGGTISVDVTASGVSETTEAESPQAPWHGILTVEGIESGDSRQFALGSLTWDTPPLPLMWQKETSHGGSTDKSVRVGSIQKLWREPDPAGRAGVAYIHGSGTIDLGSEDGAEVFRRMKDADLRGNSVDVDSVKGADVELIFPEAPTVAAEGDAPVALFSTPELTLFHRGRIRATTICEIPAFTEARLELTSESEAVAVAASVVVAAASVIEISDCPPREWFDRPTDVTPSGALTVTNEGRIYGWLAPAGTRHRGLPGREQFVPMRRVDYSRFHGGETIVAGGGRVATGAVTMNCGHASTVVSLSPEKALEHYDNTCSVVATACVGEDLDGVWIAGALLPDVNADQIRRIMACRLSGDWRGQLDRPGWSELVAALLVPVPGFAMARTAPSVSVSEGQLVAASVPVQFVDDRATLAGRIAAAAQRVRTARVQAARGRIAAQTVAFHGTHNQDDHGNWADVVPDPGRGTRNVPRPGVGRGRVQSDKPGSTIAERAAWGRRVADDYRALRDAGVPDREAVKQLADAEHVRPMDIVSALRAVREGKAGLI